jgi:hypothetical protein
MREFPPVPCRRMAGIGVASTLLLWLVVTAMLRAGANDGISGVAVGLGHKPNPSKSDTQKPAFRGVTDGAGTFVFTNVPPGSYTIWAELPAAPGQQAAADSSHDTTITFALSSAGATNAEVRLDVSGTHVANDAIHVTGPLTRKRFLTEDFSISATATITGVISGTGNKAGGGQDARTPGSPQTAGAGTGGAAAKGISGIASPVNPPASCPNLSFTYQSRTNRSLVNTSLVVTNNGPGSPVSVTVTGISCNNGFAYAPQYGRLPLPFAVPGAANLRLGKTIKFDAFFKKDGGTQTGSFTCTLRYSEGKGCKGTGVVTIPSHL